jgi:hypothetical protein
VRALVAAVLMVLGLATSASAECAWVLWATLPSPGPTEGSLASFPVGAYQTQQECMTERRKRLNKDTMLTCLPDTIDPRGPRGAGR